MSQPEPIDIDAMRAIGGYWYLATPYSRYPAGIEAAFYEACRAAAWLIRQGVGVFCPIAHTHPVAQYGGIDPLSHAIWLPADGPLMEGAAGLIVCGMDGWSESFGISEERAAFALLAKPEYFMEWPRP